MLTTSHGLNIFRLLPDNILDLNPLLSSFQSFETSIELMSLRRYPAAVITCSNAWEAALKAFLKIGPDDKVGLLDLMNEAFKKKPLLKKYSTSAHEFRETRNKLTHFGTSPGDDQKSFDLILSVGYKFYNALVRDCFGLYLNWKELAPLSDSIINIKTTDLEKCLLLPRYGDAIFDSIQLFDEFGTNKLIKDNRFCAAKLGYIISELIKQDLYTTREHFVDDFTNEYFVYLNSARSKIEDHYNGWHYQFECPVCGSDQFIGEIDSSRSTKKKIHVDRGKCVECDFQIDVGNKGVLNRLLSSQLERKSPEILKELDSDL
jgi:hypothetical protein